jgi:hypothetical protein
MFQILLLLAITVRYASGPGSSIYLLLKIVLVAWLAFRVMRALICAVLTTPRPRGIGGFLRVFGRNYFPAWMLGVAFTEMRVYVGAFCALCRIDLPWIRKNREAAKIFPFKQGGNYALVAFALLMASLIDIPIFIGLTKMAGASDKYVRGAFYLHGILLLYMVIWLISDRYHLKKSAHELLQGVLAINLGFRIEGQIHIDDVNDVVLVPRTRGWRSILPKGVRPLRVSPFEPPNILLIMKRNRRGGVLRYFGYPISIREYIFLYVDCPAELKLAIESEIVSCGSSTNCVPAPSVRTIDSLAG